MFKHHHIDDSIVITLNQCEIQLLLLVFLCIFALGLSFRPHFELTSLNFDALVEYMLIISLGTPQKMTEVLCKVITVAEARGRFGLSSVLVPLGRYARLWYIFDYK
jgi:hypothetical protein